MTQHTPKKLSGEDLIFLTEAVFAVSTELGTNESRANFLSNKDKVARLMDLHERYPENLVEQAMDSIKEVVFSQGE